MLPILHGITWIPRENMKEETSLTPQEVADILKISKGTVYLLAKRGELSSYRVGNKVRFGPSDVEDYKVRTRKEQIIRGSSAANSMDVSSHDHFEEFANPIAIQGMVISGQDIMLDILVRHLNVHTMGIPALRAYNGSYNGLYALYQGQVHVATAHLWDGEQQIYNKPFVKNMLPGVPAVLIHLARRMQGIYVASGNPKGIREISDVIRPGITIVNREKGSGTRVFLDEHLKRMGVFGSEIRGYHRESTSHLAAASIVARGGADLAFGSEKASRQVQGIEFIPVQMEDYDMVLRKEDLGKKEFQVLLQILRSREFVDELHGIGGYDLEDIGKIIYET